MKPNVYLVNLSFGLAGIERRFANVWQTLRRRDNVRPIMVVPDTLAACLYRARLAAQGDELLWTVAEHPWLRATGRLAMQAPGDMAVAFVRSRVLGRAYWPVWERIRRDPTAVVHVGLSCSALTPPDVPLVYECVDSTLRQLASRHYVRAASCRCIVHCQTDRIREALERAHAQRSPAWNTVTSPCYFASYPDEHAPAPPRDAGLIAFVGRLSAVKNPILFIDAMARMRHNGVDCRAVMWGEGPLLGAARRRIAGHELESVVEIAFVQNPTERLRQAAVFVTLQTGDNYGSQSLLEAMGAGCAVVATDVGETRRLVDDEVGLVVKPDVTALAAALTALVSDPRKTASLGAAASRRARTQHTADRYAAFLESLYSRAAALHGATRVSSLAASTSRA